MGCCGGCRKSSSWMLLTMALYLHLLNFAFNVLVPVREVLIMDEHGQRLRDLIGPYDEGSYVSLICEAEGIPHPTVTWWRESIMVDETSSQTSQGYVRNELALPKLHRSDLLMTYSCQATNTNLTVPVSASVTIDINLKPLDVRITSIQRPFSAGRKVVLACESSGARPRAQLTWWLDNKRIQGSGKETVSDNLTSSSLPFLPKGEDNGKILSCRAQNPALTNSAIEDGWTLTVQFVPELKLFLGANIQADAVKEGTDVFFECNVRANPWVNEVKWRFEGFPLQGNHSAGDIVSNHSLVLQKVKKEHRGSYQCVAVNSEGEGRSNEVMLKVKYAPVCRHPNVAVHGVARYEAVNVSCEVEADPPEVNFKWSLNNTVENIDIPSQTFEGTTSTVVYTPRTMLGYGALLCWSHNSIGHQKDPCIIRIIPAGPPESVKSCTVTNQSVSFLMVECEPGYDGGMRQSFHLEVYNSAVEHLQANVSTQDSPVFQVGNLPSATSFILVLYASNAKGRSNSVALMTNTLMPAERRTEEEGGVNVPKDETSNVSPLLAVLIGIVAVLVIVAIAIIIVMRKQNRDPDKRPPVQGNVIKCDIPLKKDADDMPDSTVESPDVIPNTNESQVYIADTGELMEKDETTYEFFKSKDYPYDYITAVRSQKSASRGGDEEITYAELSHKESQQCAPVVNRMQPPTEYAELDFQRRMYPWPAPREGSLRASMEAGEFPLTGAASNKSKESLNIPETTTETTPL